MDENRLADPAPTSPIRVPPWLIPPEWQQQPNAARIYDYFLGGDQHFPADRAAAEHFLARDPDCFGRAQVNRRFLQRCVRYLCAQGITQFLDLGSGLPTAGNVHEIARECLPETRTLYVDRDPVAIMQTTLLLNDQQIGSSTHAIQADLCDATALLASEKVHAFLDFQRPIALLCFAVLHFVGDDAQAAQAMQALRDALAPGSYLAISHASLDGAPPALVEQYETVYAQSVTQFKGRSQSEIEAFFGDFSLLPPGVAFVPAWHPTDTDLWAEQPGRALIRGGVARKA